MGWGEVGGEVGGWCAGEGGVGGGGEGGCVVGRDDGVLGGCAGEG